MLGQRLHLERVYPFQFCDLLDYLDEYPIWTRPVRPRRLGQDVRTFYVLLQTVLLVLNRVYASKDSSPDTDADYGKNFVEEANDWESPR